MGLVMNNYYYKATNADMTCRGYQFEMNTDYFVEGDVIPCMNGFHACSELKDVFRYYGDEEVRLFKVELLGTVVRDHDKSAGQGVRFIEELKWEDLDELKDDPEWHIRRAVAAQGMFLDHLKDDPDEDIRRAVAEQGMFLDHLKDDPDEDVRRAVAEQGKFLDELKNDPHWVVRRAVAEQGKFLDELKDDHYWRVRKEANLQLEKLIE